MHKFYNITQQRLYMITKNKDYVFSYTRKSCFIGCIES